MKITELSLYVKVWREIASPYFNSSLDYMAIQTFLKDAVEKLVI